MACLASALQRSSPGLFLSPLLLPREQSHFTCNRSRISNRLQNRPKGFLKHFLGLLLTDCILFLEMDLWISKCILTLAAMLLAFLQPLLTQNAHVRICLHLHHLCLGHPICQSRIPSSVPTQRNGGGAKELAERQREGRSMRWKSPVITDEVYRRHCQNPPRSLTHAA
ncbi:hypothetical protein QQF64_001673 [Cirrhinus molitorella]|uniref:Uncharacterized protein n=1 Tax=Cirrhinus molitorella TaxID=172907 RepID=A0ABR3P0R9_9TELE